VVRRALPAGDYSIEGLEDSVAVERKTLEDFVSTVIRSRKRFTRELQRLAGYEAACIVVEADLSDILGGRLT
jgi:ERCC4-type nuclease